MLTAADKRTAPTISIIDEPNHRLVIENEYIRAYAVEVGPHGRTLCHVHAVPYLMYVAGQSEIISYVTGGERTNHRYSDAYCEFRPAGLEHVVENVSDTPFRNLIIEVLPATAALRRAGLPYNNVASVSVSSLYSGPTCCLELVDLGSGSQMQVTGPAIVASAYEDSVEFISPENGVRKLDHFQDLEYVRVGSTGLLRCESGRAVRAIVVTLGHE